MPVTNPDEMYVNGVQMFEGRLFNATATTIGGNVVYYLTHDGTASGLVVFSTVIMDSIMLTPVTGDGTIAFGAPVLSGDKKTLTVPVTKQTFSGVTVVGINVLGSVSIGPAPNGVPVRMMLQGIV